jgi:hypothetical protein
MSIAEKKQFLLHIVEDADEKLTGLLIALANEYNDAEQNYTQDELDSFKDRKKAFFDNNKKGSSVEEAHDRIRRNYHNEL